MITGHAAPVLTFFSQARAAWGLHMNVVGRWISLSTSTLVVTGLLAGVQGAAAEPEPVVAEPSTLAESFPTLFAPSTDPANAATLGTVLPTGDVPILNAPGDGSISLDSGQGMRFELATGETIGVTRSGSASPGIAGETAVTYSSPQGDWAARPTADGGGEIIDELPAGTTETTYDFDLPEGTRLVELEKGDVAVVRDGATPMPEIAAAAQELSDAEEQVVEASTDQLLAAEEDEALNDELEELSSGPEDLLASSAEEPVTDLPAADDSPAYLEPDAPLDVLRAAADDLESGLPESSFVEATQDIVSSARASAADARTADELEPVANDAAVESASAVDANQALEEVFGTEPREDTAAVLAAELDLGDPSAEVDRAVDAVVEAQSEVGSDGRVEGVFSAPISKTLDTHAPVPSVMSVSSPTSVDVTVPDTGEDVVVDPFFVPVLLIVARVAAQRVLPVVVKAAAKYVAKKAVKSGFKAAVDRARAAAAHQLTMRAQQAARALQQARIWAAQQARARVAQAAQAAARARAHAARLRELARQSAIRAREHAVSAARALAQRAAVLRNATRAAGRVVVKRAVTAGRAVVQKVVRAVQVGTKAVADAKRAVSEAVRRGVERARRALERAAEAARRRLSEASQRARETLERAVERARQNPDLVDDVSGEAADLLFDAVTGADPCVPFDEVDVLDPPTTRQQVMVKAVGLGVRAAWCVADRVTDGERDEQGEEQAAADDVDTYRNAQAEARDRAVEFEVSASSEPSADLLTVTIPSSFPVGKQRFIQFRASNFGAALPLSETFIYSAAGIPGASSGTLDSGRKVVLTDENGDGVWSKGEVATGIVGVTPAVTTSRIERMSTTFITSGRVFGPTASFQLSVAGTPEPVQPTAGSGTSGAVRLTWPAPSAGGEPISSYEVRRSDTGAVARVTSTSHTWSGLSNGTTYTFTARACSSLGCGPWSSGVSGKPYTVPGTPARPSISSLDNAVRLAWSAPSNGGSSIVRFEVAGSLSGSTTGTSYTFGRGQNADAQSMKVRACNAAGCGPYSSASASLRPKVIQLVRGTRAKYGYHYDTRVFGPAGWRPTITCNDGQYRNWAGLTITLDGNGYWRSATRCYSGFANPHWVNAGGLKSNSISW
ncbi:hypothetical protein GCM10009737_16660 [Nocardioides lentus]|uniref:Fibronectin type-III domain-containing protein n=1 Tax=Nocardioides lentus TaxID=338077 RepID=A0ABN2PCL0_9ACTN